MAITIKDIARIAGVSIGTVSNYINGTKPVNFETAEKIKQAIKDTSYEPNYLAKNLRTQKHNDIGVILPSFDNPYYVKIFEGIESVIRETSYSINLALTYNRNDYEKQCIENLLRKQISGLILVTCMPNSWEFYFNTFTSKNKPLILLDRTIKNLEAGFITFNYEETVFQLTSNLIQSGKKHIYLFVESTDFDCEEKCLKGFEAAHTANNLTYTSSQVVAAINNKEDAFRATINLLKHDIPDAIMTTSENKAIGITESLLFLGYSKDDITIVSLGEDYWNEKTHSVASVSTRRPAYEMGTTAARNILELIQYPISDNKQLILKDRINDSNLSSFNILVSQKEQLVPKQKDKINVLMLETPQTHALISMLRNFSTTTGIEPDIEIVDHQHLLKRIQKEQVADSESAYADVFMFDIPWLKTLVQNNLVADITDLTSNSSLYDSIFLPETAEYFGQIEDRVYGLPFMHALQILYYRKDLFEDLEIQSLYKKKYRSPLKPPETWKEFNTITEFFTQETDAINYGTSIPGAYPECLSPEIFLRFFSQNNNIFNENGQVNFNNPRTLKVYTQFMQIFQHAKPNWKQSNDEDVVKDFLNGETAMLVSYPSFLNELLVKTECIIKKENIGFSPTPMKTPILGGWGLGISPKTTKKEECYNFLEWACMDKISNYFSLMGGFTAVEKTYKNDELIKTYPWFSSYYASNKTAKPMVNPRNSSNKVIPQSKIDEIIYKWFCEMVDNKISIPDAISNTQKDLEELFGFYVSGP